MTPGPKYDRNNLPAHIRREFGNNPTPRWFEEAHCKEEIPESAESMRRKGADV